MRLHQQSIRSLRETVMQKNQNDSDENFPGGGNQQKIAAFKILRFI